jgi:uncharacterized damage-inducible protein DinB
MHRVIPGILLTFVLMPAAIGLAQSTPPPAAPTPQPNPLSAHTKMMYRGVKGILIRSAELMPEENYGFKPTESVRSFGQIIGHVADSQYTFCSRVLGEARPALKIEETKTSKADLIAALKAAVAYCDKAYDGMTDETAVERVKLMGSESPKLGALGVNNTHTIEHYGNIIVYLRMKNIVPPTSDQAFMQEMMKK